MADLAGAADAELRLLFEEIAGQASNPNGEWYLNWRPVNPKEPCGPMIVWQRLYEGVRDSQNGLEVVGCMERQRQRIEDLECEVARLNARDANPRALLLPTLSGDTPQTIKRDPQQETDRAP